jgi:hypothetical protein
LYNVTGLRSKADNWAWPYSTPSGQRATGYVLLVAQERNLQLGTLGPGMHEDVWYRPNHPELNPDIRNADALIDWAVASYGDRVDRRRIYVMGFSNGAIFGQLYGIVRHPSTTLAGVPDNGYGRPTPRGNYNRRRRATRPTPRWPSRPAAANEGMRGAGRRGRTLWTCGSSTRGWAQDACPYAAPRDARWSETLSSRA